MKVNRQGQLRGFTLAELMVVVTIVTILATIAVMALGGHRNAAKTGETLAMMQSIRGAQERWRSENLLYLDVSLSGQWFPPGTPGNGRRSFMQAAASHADGLQWIWLNPTSNPAVYGAFQTRAGMAGTAMMSPLVGGSGITWPVAADTKDAWYVIQGITDMDMDGHYGFFVASSLNGDVYRQDEHE